MLFTPPNPGYAAFGTPWLRWTTSSHGKVAYRVVSPDARGHGPGFVVLFAHGNACDIADAQLLGAARAAAQALHSDVYLYDYCGYGQSNDKCQTGPSCTAATTEAMFEVVCAAAVDASVPIVLIGHSLGAAAICELIASYDAVSHNVAAVFVISAFVTPMGVLHPVLRVLRSLDRYDNNKALERASNYREPVPIAFVTGVEDSIVSPQDIRDLYESYAGPKTLIEIPNANHMTLINNPWLMIETLQRAMEELDVEQPSKPPAVSIRTQASTFSELPPPIEQPPKLLTSAESESMYRQLIECTIADESNKTDYASLACFLEFYTEPPSVDGQTAATSSE